MKDYAEISRQYCIAALEDTLPNRKASKLEKLACKRQLEDLIRQESDDFDYYFDVEAGNRHCRFMEMLPHVTGEWRGTLLTLSPYQVFMHHTLFGWKNKDTGYRRFSKVYWELPRKNGKSICASGIGLYCGFAEGEHGAEIYAGAVTEKQAGMVFSPAWKMVQMMPELKEAFGLELAGTIKNPTSIYCATDMSKFEPVVGKPGDGANVCVGIADEYHEHSTSVLVDTFQTGTGSRQQSIILIITTAGFDTSFPCYFEHIEAVKILERSIIKENVFAVVFGVDEDSNWEDFESWKMANPNYGISIHESKMREFYGNAITSLKDRNVLLCKHLNKWMNAGSAWMDMTKWNACENPSLKLEDFKGSEIFLGLDLANKIDLCALMLTLKKGDSIITFGKYYLNEERIALKENDHYRKWRDEGWLTETQGAVTDFTVIANDLKQLDKDFVIKEMAYDPHECSMFMGEVRVWAGFDCIEYKQGPQNISEPMKTLESYVYDGKLQHSGDPILTWAVGNVIKKMARGGGETKYYYPAKQTAANKIDPAVALIMSLGRLMFCEDLGGAYEARAAAGDERILRVL